MRVFPTVCAALALAASSGGCRLGRYELTEPLDGRAIQVKSGDRLGVLLDENMTTGYCWQTECDDDDISFEREEIEPADGSPLCGVSAKVRIVVRVHRGFDGPAHVKLVCRRPWKGGDTARTINLLLYKKAEDNAPWK